MTPDAAVPLDQLIDSLGIQVEDAEIRLRQRQEWAAAQALVDDLRGRREALLADAAALDDAIREGEACRDLLDLARAELAEEAAVERQVKKERLAGDEGLIRAAEDALRLYAGTLLASFLLPPFFLAYPPLAKALPLGLIPALYGFLRVRAALEPFAGRTWLVLQDPVNLVEDRIRKAHVVGLGVVVLAALWLVLAFLRVEAQA